MNYEELSERVRAMGPRARYSLSWYDGLGSEANYTIVPLADGKFTVYRPSGRGENFPDYDSEGRERVFDSEDAVCDFVWSQLSSPKPKPESDSEPFTMPTPEQIAEQRRRGFASLGLEDPHVSGDDPTP
jgi:hypothetical protein